MGAQQQAEGRQHQVVAADLILRGQVGQTCQGAGRQGDFKQAMFPCAIPCRLLPVQLQGRDALIQAGNPKRLGRSTCLTVQPLLLPLHELAVVTARRRHIGAVALLVERQESTQENRQRTAVEYRVMKGQQQHGAVVLGHLDEDVHSQQGVASQVEGLAGHGVDLRFQALEVVHRMHPATGLSIDRVAYPQILCVELKVDAQQRVQAHGLPGSVEQSLRICLAADAQGVGNVVARLVRTVALLGPQTLLADTRPIPLQGRLGGCGCRDRQALTGHKLGQLGEGATAQQLRQADVRAITGSNAVLQHHGGQRINAVLAHRSLEIQLIGCQLQQ
ncbi:hypothetical protein D3C78_647420 [compost metagenome]